VAEQMAVFLPAESGYMFTAETSEITKISSMKLSKLTASDLGSGIA